MTAEAFGHRFGVSIKRGDRLSKPGNNDLPGSVAGLPKGFEFGSSLG
jgi:hypothetical protein